LAAVLSDSEQYEVIEFDWVSDDRLERIERFPSQLWLIDFDLPEKLAVELVEQIRVQVDDAKVILLVSGDEEELIADWANSGANGWVLPDSPLDELKTAIDVVRRDGSYCPPRVAHSVFAQLGKLARHHRLTEQIEPSELTLRELEVLRLIAEQNLSNKQIAKKLSVSVYTVKNHVHHILEKLSVQNRHDAAKHAVQQRWLAGTPRQRNFEMQ
jgi:DNA-binding NarL/FixJ family response regulator